MGYVYIQTERNPALFTVGFYKPDGSFETDSDHNYRENAAVRVNYLNGGIDSDTAYSIKTLCDNVYTYGITTL